VKITIAWIGKTKNPAIQSLSDEYIKRLLQFSEVDGVSLKDEAALLKLSGREGKNPRRYLILLDSRGKQLSSESFAEHIGRLRDSGTQSLIFAIGPADGWSAAARTRASLILSFGAITLPHELARAVLAEQIYRALTILANHPYHSGH
jgi:23S rRNA (pseudouridine1915-N3)-methyltransferase